MDMMEKELTPNNVNFVTLFCGRHVLQLVSALLKALFTIGIIIVTSGTANLSM